MISIYGLFDPRTNELRYIGKSFNCKARLATHIREARTRNVLHSRRWIAGILSDGGRPELCVLDSAISHDEANEAERFWIASMLLAGCNLTNRTPGGDGQPKGYKPSRESIEQGRKKLLGRKRTPEQLINLRAAFNSPEIRALRRLNARPQNFGNGRLGLHDSDETKRKKSASWTPERKAAHAKVKSALPMDDRWRAQLAAAIKARGDKYRADGCPKRSYNKNRKVIA